MSNVYLPVWYEIQKCITFALSIFLIKKKTTKQKIIIRIKNKKKYEKIRTTKNRTLPPRVEHFQFN